MSNPNPARTGKQAAHPTFSQLAIQRLNELEVLRLAVEEGLGGSEIARQLGIHKSTVTRVLQRIMARNEAPLVEQKRAMETAVLLAARERLLTVLYTDHPQVSDGQVVRDPDGTALIDDGPVIAASRELRGNSESMRKLWGLDAPSKAEVRITDDLTAEIEQLAAELASAGDAGPDRGVTGRSPESVEGSTPSTTRPGGP